MLTPDSELRDSSTCPATASEISAEDSPRCTRTPMSAIAVAQPSVTVRPLTSAASRSTSSATALPLLLASAVAGVNLDEEAARLIQYQQSYQAAAKVLQVAQALFDTLLNTAGN